VARHKKVLSLVDRGSILLVVYSAFSDGVVSGIWQAVSIPQLVGLIALCTLLLTVVLVITTRVSWRLGFCVEDEITIVMCGSKKSMASGLPMASVLFPASTVSLTVLPLMLFHQIQLLACAWLARRYASRPEQETRSADAGEPVAGSVAVVGRDGVQSRDPGRARARSDG
jgi:sodium/bile acid cotransporter 7